MTRQRGVSHYHVAQYGFPPDLFNYLKSLPLPSGRASLVGRVLLEGRTVQIADASADPDYRLIDAQRMGGYRTLLGVPLLRQACVIGVLTLTRSEVQPFTERQIELVTTFADQAVIAIENTRLFEEVQARNTELKAALEQQTATAEVLKVISRSAFDLQAVLDALVESAAKLCGGDDVSMFRLEGSNLVKRCSSRFIEGNCWPLYSCCARYRHRAQRN
jgi:two-component system, NtrC family, sensor kinase